MSSKDLSLMYLLDPVGEDSQGSQNLKAFLTLEDLVKIGRFPSPKLPSALGLSVGTKEFISSQSDINWYASLLTFVMIDDGIGIPWT